ncbi:sugar phosphate nucleotidyltransferase [Marinigracilibium pacificum]|uniref:NTP transferase domain-containing protein n=1 Tax=Marinigracilibium pacificum TaxID=2729599 RepID=A0A848J1M1_9BACT|nr:sugar phosphate nucleotidyltransferase [Marinigracilibium pacificum]NMM47112.1 NTP transferase domain-containing protein [Marinigracilibium pacificum]
MKAIIPVAGSGTHLRPLTHTQPKCLLPLAGKPILGHIIDYLDDSGVTEMIFVVGHLSQKIERFLLEFLANRTIKYKTIFQQPGMGLGHAIFLAHEDFKDEKEIIIHLGDSIIRTDKDFFKHKSDESLICLKKVDVPGNFGICEVDQEGRIKKMVEKPKVPKSNLAIVGLYRIRQISDFISYLQKEVELKKGKDEAQLTDALQEMLSNGALFKMQKTDRWFDCSRKESLLEANRMLMHVDGEQTDNVSLYPRTIIIPPVVIGKGCQISNAIIGPNVVVGHESEITDAIIKESIIGNTTQIRNTVIQESIIGNDSTFFGSNLKLNLGDNTDIDLTS